MLKNYVAWPAQILFILRSFVRHFFHIMPSTLWSVLSSSEPGIVEENVRSHWKKPVLPPGGATSDIENSEVAATSTENFGKGVHLFKGKCYFLKLNTHLDFFRSTSQ